MEPLIADTFLLFGRFALHPRRRLLLDGDEAVPLGSRALDLLIALVQRHGRVVSRSELEACIWPDTVVEETSLRVHASRLRRALRDGENGARYIVNVPGRGYAFVAEVMQMPQVPATASHLEHRLDRAAGELIFDREVDRVERVQRQQPVERKAAGQVQRHEPRNEDLGH